MKALYDVPAPAKLNLFLHITGRRPDGYHLLQSVFMLIDWCDTLHFEVRADGLITRDDLDIALPPDDLTVRAARALQARTACPLGVHISVHKRIPSEAGLGGGSSDAATTLIALNQLWNLRLSRRQLRDLAPELGADVAFFLGTGSAWVEGTGELVTPLTGSACPPEQQFVVVKPAGGCATPAIFSRLQAKDYFGSATISGFAANHFGYGRNDLQGTAQTLCPELAQALDWLKALGLQGRMSGSGSAVFAAMPLNFELSEAPQAWEVKICSNLARHPLAGWSPE